MKFFYLDHYSQEQQHLILQKRNIIDEYILLNNDLLERYKNNLNKIDIHRTIHKKLDSVFKFGLHSLEIKISNR